MRIHLSAKESSPYSFREALIRVRLWHSLSLVMVFMVDKGFEAEEERRRLTSAVAVVHVWRRCLGARWTAAFDGDHFLTLKAKACYQIEATA